MGGAARGDNRQVIGVRFRPPRVALPSERRWALVRAFGPADAPVPGAFDADEAARVTLALDLAARVGARAPLQRLSDELGRTAALRVFEAHARRTERSRAVDALARELAALAGEIALPVAFLKGAALFLSGVVRPDRRPAGDVDLLVPAERAKAFARALCARGFRRADVPADEHHLAPLVDPGGRVVEVHLFVPHVRVPGTVVGGGATFDALRAAGALERVVDLPGDVRVPRRDLLAAHAVAHGLAQGGFTPHVYSLARVVSDVIDLGLPADADLARRALTWIDGDVTRDEFEGLVTLARRLEAGDTALFDEAQRGSGAPDGVLLRHAVAGALDDGYRRVLRARSALAGRGVRARLRAARRALALTDAQVDALYGRPASRLGYAWRRVLRPFDLARRLLQAHAAARRL